MIILCRSSHLKLLSRTTNKRFRLFDKSFAIRQCRCPILIDILQAAKRITNFRRPFPRFISVLSSHSGQFTATQDGQMDWNESPEVSTHPLEASLPHPLPTDSPFIMIYARKFICIYMSRWLYCIIRVPRGTKLVLN